MRIPVKRVVEICSYLLYTLLVLLFMLWYQFPAKAVKSRVEAELHNLTPDLYWHIGSIGLRPPADIRLNDIRITGAAKEGKTQFVFDSLSLRPELAGWRKTGEMAASYHLQLFGGRIIGHLQLAANRNRFQFRGALDGIKLTKQTLGKLLKGYDREVSGQLSGSFTGSGQLQNRSRLKELAGKIRLDKGKISLQEPVLGMNALNFNQLSSDFKYGSEVVRFTSGSMEAKLLAAEFTGTLKPVVHNLPLSNLHLKGSLIPRPEFLASIGDAMAVNLLKQQLQDGKLPFIINGTLTRPGIVFPGLPADLNRQLQGGRK